MATLTASIVESANAKDEYWRNFVVNPFFAGIDNPTTQGEISEQNLYQDLISEAIEVYGQEFRYIPRQYVAKDEILGEDRLSTFEHSYPIPCYVETVMGFEGQGAFIDKFGLMNQKSATLTVGRDVWKRVVGDAGNSILPNRPSEGDLLYFPLSGGLFEIMFVQHEDPFYQVGKHYVYKLEVELFRYSGETINTGDASVDVFETLKSHDVTVNPNPDTVESFGDNTKLNTEGDGIIFDVDNPFGDA